jgi:hypothetical protein
VPVVWGGATAKGSAGFFLVLARFLSSLLSHRPNGAAGPPRCGILLQAKRSWGRVERASDWSYSRCRWPVDEVQLLDDDVPLQLFEFVDSDDEGHGSEVSLHSSSTTCCCATGGRVAQRVRVLAKRARVNKRPKPAEPHAIGADHGSRHVHSQLRVVALADDGVASGHARQGVQGSELTPASVFRFALFSSLGQAVTTADKTDRKLQLFWNVGTRAAVMDRLLKH